jgi:hypothetical protein
VKDDGGASWRDRATQIAADSSEAAAPLSTESPIGEASALNDPSAPTASFSEQGQADLQQNAEESRTGLTALATLAPLAAPGFGALPLVMRGLMMAGAGGTAEAAGELIAPSESQDEKMSRIRNAMAVSGLSEGFSLLARPAAKAAEGLDAAAGTQRAKAAAGTRGSSKQARNAVGGSGAFQEAGNEGVERGLLRPVRDLLPGGSEASRNRVLDELARSGKGIEKSLEAADKLGFGPKIDDLKKALNAAAGDLRELPNSNATQIGELERLMLDAEEFAKANGGIVPPTKLQKLKERADDLVTSWDPERKSKSSERLRKSFYEVFKNAQEEAADQIPGALETYRKEKRAYEVAKKVQKLHGIADGKAGDGNLLGGLTGTGAAGIGALTFGAPGAIAANLGARTLTSPAVQGLGLKGAANVSRLFGQASQSPGGPVGIRALLQAILAGGGQQSSE